MYSRSKKLTSTEKKLQALKTQLYGKEVVADSPKVTISVMDNQRPATSPSANMTTDIHHLKKDLFKTCYLAGGLIGLQLILHFSGLSSKLSF